jgi:prevent-host-death family protein
MTTNKDKALQPGSKGKRLAKRHGAVVKGRAPWQLREAKARLSEVVDRVHREGPQHVTVRGKREVVIVTAEEFRRLKGEITGKALVDLLARSPLREVEIERLSVTSPVRDVEL